MKKYIFSALILASVGIFQSCRNEFDIDYSTQTPSSGTADFSKYVALGNSLTSGFRDNALYQSGQSESYPNILATQMKFAGGGEFKQPLMSDDIGGFVGLLKGKLSLVVRNGAFEFEENTAQSPFTSIAAQGPYNNMGIPGAKSYHLASPFLEKNPYYKRIATQPGTSSVISDAVAQKPTFFSLWIGNNDILSYATSGGIGKNQTGNTNILNYGDKDITDPNVVFASINGYVKAMKNAGAKGGVLANIPNISDIPFFNTIPYNAIPLNEDQAKALNSSIFSRLRAALSVLGQADRIQLMVAGQNPVLFKDDKLKDLSAPLTTVLERAGVPRYVADALGKIFGQARHATAADRILLPTQKVLNRSPENTLPGLEKYGISYPLEDEHVLSAGEVEEVRVATVAYNKAILQIAKENDLALADINAAFNTLGKNTGLLFDGVKYSTAFVTGGTFSLDGVHPTGRGAAILANEFIKAINLKYGASLPQVNPNNYSGIKFPK